ncbi:hypothetical protein CRE_27424 [Caenorhabditis remanei]|uniref:Major sperm protein n=1 Tax=Caenorhabditis remanei TaxID=31234 RepID=E3LNJ2_CAERE|nr:hypothetical protein CRE_27424 [Caenorhabditis remanei]
MANADLSKVSFNPSTSVTYQAVGKKQQVKLEITNNSTSALYIKFKNTNPAVFRTKPADCKMLAGEKKDFKCMFKGATKEELGKKVDGQRFSIVVTAVSANANTEVVKRQAFKTTSLKHKINILFAGINDQKEAQQPTNNDDVEDKDREGQMRAKGKNEPPKVKRANVVMFMRKEGESISDEDDEEGGGTAPAAQAPSDDMMTTRPAGNFTGQVASNENLGGPTSPTSDMKTTRPAGNFTGQVASNAVPGAPVDPKSVGLLTTRPAGAFNGQVTPNAVGSSADKDNLKTTRPAGSFENPQRSNK